MVTNDCFGSVGEISRTMHWGDRGPTRGDAVPEDEVAAKPGAEVGERDPVVVGRHDQRWRTPSHVAAPSITLQRGELGWWIV